MSKTFRNLVLLPIVFLLAIVTAIGFTVGSWTPLLELPSWESTFTLGTALSLKIQPQTSGLFSQSNTLSMSSQL